MAVVVVDFDVVVFGDGGGGGNVVVILMELCVYWRLKLKQRKRSWFRLPSLLGYAFGCWWWCCRLLFVAFKKNFCS